MKYLLLFIIFISCNRKDSSNVLSDPKWNIDKDEWVNNYLDTAQAYKSFYDGTEFIKTYHKLSIHGYISSTKVDLDLSDSLNQMFLIDSTNLSWKHRINPLTIKRIANLYITIPKSKSYSERLDSVYNHYEVIIKKYQAIANNTDLDIYIRYNASIHAEQSIIDALIACNRLPLKNY